MRLVTLAIVLAASAAHADPWLWSTKGTYVNDVAVAPDGSVAVVANNSIVQLTPEGKVRATTTFAQNKAVVNGLAFAADGDLIAVGVARTEHHDEDGFVTRYAPDGKERWTTKAEGSGGLALTSLSGVAVQGDAIVAVGQSRGDTKVGDKTLATGGIAIVLAGKDGAVRAAQLVDAGTDNQLVGVCATTGGYVVTGETRPKGGDALTVHGLAADGAERWSYTEKDSRGDRVACVGDRAIVGVRRSSKGGVDLVELDAAGKQTRTTSVKGDKLRNVMSLSATATETLVTLREDGKGDGVATRVARYKADGTLVSNDAYKSSAGDDPVWLRALLTPKGVVYAGEVEKKAALSLRGKSLSGPVLFVIGP